MDFPEVIYMLGFDILEVNSGTGIYTLKRKTQNIGFSYISPDLALTKVATFTVNSLNQMPNFFRLETIIDINKAYSTADLNTTSSLVPSANQFLLFETGLAFSCQTNKFLGI